MPNDAERATRAEDGGRARAPIRMQDLRAFAIHILKRAGRAVTGDAEWLRTRFICVQRIGSGQLRGRR